MMRYRWKRGIVWAAGISGSLALLVLVPMEDWVSGTFKTRSLVRKEVRAPVPGFLQGVHCDEGETVESGRLVGCLEIPDLVSKLAQKRAEESEAEAKLKLLLAGTRPEQLAEQRARVRRATEWRDRAQQDLARRRAALKEELNRLDRAITQARTQVGYSHIAWEQARKLLKDNALPDEQYREAERQHIVAREQLGQAEAQKRERATLGTLEPEGELAKRQKDLGEEQAALNLMEAGTRPEEVEAERARLARLQHEKAYLASLQERLRLISPVSGVVVTPHLREKVGQYFKEGDLICEIEDPLSLEIEVPLEEQDVRRVESSNEVLLKPRALPLQSCQAEVERIAPQAVAGKVQSTVNVYCKLKEPVPELRSGMTGYARIYCGRTCLAGYLGGRAVRYFRTEIWW
jgi:multidrug resistance efflux pump